MKHISTAANKTTTRAVKFDVVVLNYSGFRNNVRRPKIIKVIFYRCFQGQDCALLPSEYKYKLVILRLFSVAIELALL